MRRHRWPAGPRPAHSGFLPCPGLGTQRVLQASCPVGDHRMGVPDLKFTATWPFRRLGSARMALSTLPQCRNSVQARQPRGDRRRLQSRRWQRGTLSGWLRRPWPRQLPQWHQFGRSGSQAVAWGRAHHQGPCQSGGSVGTGEFCPTFGFKDDHGTVSAHFLWIRGSNMVLPGNCSVIVTGMIARECCPAGPCCPCAPCRRALSNPDCRISGKMAALLQSADCDGWIRGNPIQIGMATAWPVRSDGQLTRLK